MFLNIKEWVAIRDFTNILIKNGFKVSNPDLEIN